MPDDFERAIIQHSVRDVIGILENQPVQPDVVGQLTAAQLMNRASLAHLSIERALKFLITQAGGPLIEKHHLGRQLRELVRYDRKSADSLEHAFLAAVRHYRFNPNASDMGHLRTLESYFDQAGSNQAFQDVRYWELDQSLDQVVLRRLSIWLHIELLHALHGLLRLRQLSETVASRVERTVDNAMSSVYEPASDLPAAQPTSIRSYVAWRQDYTSSSEALADAVQREFMIGDGFMNGMIAKAYRALLESKDPAVRYFAETLNVLPRQRRDAVTRVEWLGDPEQQRGLVKTPSGVTLGEIERRWDGLWNATVLVDELAGRTDKAKSQTDAMCFLAEETSRVAEVTLNGERREVRIVANRETLLDWELDQFGDADGPPSAEDGRRYRVVFWESDHGLKPGDRVEVRVRARPTRPLVHVLNGIVDKVETHQVHLLGLFSYEADDGDADEAQACSDDPDPTLPDLERSLPADDKPG